MLLLFSVRVAVLAPFREKVVYSVYRVCVSERLLICVCASIPFDF